MAAPVLAMCLRVLRNRSAAEDVAQDTMAELWTTASRYDAARGSEVSWALMIARRRAIDRVRSGRNRGEREERYTSLLSTSPTDEVADDVLRRLEAADLRNLCQRLTQRQQHVIYLVFSRGCTLSETAAILGVPLGTAKTRLRDAVLRLRREQACDHVGKICLRW